MLLWVVCSLTLPCRGQIQYISLKTSHLYRTVLPYWIITLIWSSEECSSYLFAFSPVQGVWLGQWGTGRKGAEEDEGLLWALPKVWPLVSRTNLDITLRLNWLACCVYFFYSVCSLSSALQNLPSEAQHLKLKCLPLFSEKGQCEEYQRANTTKQTGKTPLAATTLTPRALKGRSRHARQTAERPRCDLYVSLQIDYMDFKTI